MTLRQSELMKHNIQRGYIPKRQPRKIWKVLKTFFFVILVSLIVSLSFSWKVVSSQKSIIDGLTQLPVVSQIKKLITGNSIKLEGAKDDRINFLLLGQGGVGHEGPYLTDTIILASIKPSTGQVSMLSIPRDFSILIPGYGYRKINEVNSIGEVNEYEGGGSAYAAQILEDVLDIPIHYQLRIDFEGFKTAIDKIGGIEVCVDKPFTDNQYPTDDFGTQTLSFEQGCQKMDSERALEYARSRHGNNGEGSDFARSKRQQKIILAIKDKIFDWKTALNPNRIYSIIEAVENHTQTNIGVWQVPNFIKLASKIDFEHVTQKSLDSSTNGYLKNMITEDGAYILVPRTGNYSEIRYLVQNIFTVNQIEKETARIVILNGTQVSGLAQAIADEMVILGMQVLDVNNAPGSVTEEYEKTVIYRLNTEEKKKEALSMIKNQLGLPNVTDNLPNNFDEYFFPQDDSIYVPEKQDIDFLVVLGLDQATRMIEEGKIEVSPKVSFK